MRYRASFVFAAALLAVVAFPASGFADPPGLLYDPVPAHQHFVSTQTGAMVAVGPQICENPNLQLAFNQFHHNVHHSFVPGVGVIHTLGPQDGAAGLNNDRGGELVAVRGCS